MGDHAVHQQDHVGDDEAHEDRHEHHVRAELEGPRVRVARAQVFLADELEGVGDGLQEAERAGLLGADARVEAAEHLALDVDEAHGDDSHQADDHQQPDEAVEPRVEAEQTFGH